MNKNVISYYAPFFHDGSIIEIVHRDNSILVSMYSAEIDETDLKDDIILSKFDRISGKLHLENIERITVNGVFFEKALKMKYDYGSIFDFEIQGNSVELQISWQNIPQKPVVNDFSTIVIQAGCIWWENIPDLYDPFW